MSYILFTIGLALLLAFFRADKVKEINETCSTFEERNAERMKQGFIFQALTNKANRGDTDIEISKEGTVITTISAPILFPIVVFIGSIYGTYKVLKYIMNKTRKGKNV